MTFKILTGFFAGIVANLIGIIFYVTLFSKFGIEETIQLRIEDDTIGHLILLGAILNFIPFFVFLRKHQYYRARGVVLASLLAAIIIAVTKFL